MSNEKSEEDYSDKLEKALDFESVVYPFNPIHKQLIAGVSLLRDKLNAGFADTPHTILGPLKIEIEPGAFPLKVVLRIPDKQFFVYLFEVDLGPPVLFDGKPCPDLAQAILDYCQEKREHLFWLRGYSRSL